MLIISKKRFSDHFSTEFTAVAILFVGWLLLSLGLMAVLALPFSFLWNAALVSAIPSLPSIGYWQSLGLFLLVWIGKWAFVGIELSAKFRD